jgi:hypothetical protein
LRGFDKNNAENWSFPPTGNKEPAIPVDANVIRVGLYRLHSPTPRTQIIAHNVFRLPTPREPGEARRRRVQRLSREAYILARVGQQPAGLRRGKRLLSDGNWPCLHRSHVRDRALLVRWTAHSRLVKPAQ